LLSFAPLTTRGTVIDFLTALTQKLSGHTRRLLRGLLLTAFHEAMEPRNDSIYSRYGHGPVSAPARHAAFSANLLVLITLIGGPVTGRELFPDGLFPAADWRRHATLWRSQFTGEAWRNLAATLRLQRIWHADEREICVSFERWDAPRLDAFWTFRIPPSGDMRKGYGWRHVSAEEIRRESYFICDTVNDVVCHGLEAVALEMDLYGQSASAPRGHAPL
jgi:hypothetical protein